MRDDNVLDIISLCIAINRRASEIYLMLSKVGDNEELKLFWTEMGREEKKHAAFWDMAKETAEAYGLPHVFDDPQETRNELEQVLQKVTILLKRWESNQIIENALILAYRLEYYMLHPAFELLYHTLKPLVGDLNPGELYDQRINRFIEMFVKHGDVTPELELLGETLQSLWHRNKVLARLAMIDSLTGLLNRHGFLILAKELSYLAQRNKENMGILMIDIDRFKRINDQYGHPKGDKILKKVAESMMACVRKSDILGRYGGEEFIILFPAIQPAALMKMAEKIRQGVENTRLNGITVTISIGAVQGKIKTNPDKELFSWIAKADAYLYQAKANGRNRVVSGE